MEGVKKGLYTDFKIENTARPHFLISFREQALTSPFDTPRKNTSPEVSAKVKRDNLVAAIATYFGWLIGVVRL